MEIVRQVFVFSLFYLEFYVEESLKNFSVPAADSYHKPRTSMPPVNPLYPLLYLTFPILISRTFNTSVDLPFTFVEGNEKKSIGLFWFFKVSNTGQLLFFQFIRPIKGGSISLVLVLFFETLYQVMQVYISSTCFPSLEILLQHHTSYL